MSGRCRQSNGWRGAAGREAARFKLAALVGSLCARLRRDGAAAVARGCDAMDANNGAGGQNKKKQDEGRMTDAEAECGRGLSTADLFW